MLRFGVAVCALLLRYVVTGSVLERGADARDLIQAIVI